MHKALKSSEARLPRKMCYLIPLDSFNLNIVEGLHTENIAGIIPFFHWAELRP